MKSILSLQNMAASREITLHVASTTSVNCKTKSGVSLFVC